MVFIGWRAAAKERNMSPIARTVYIAWQALHKLQRYTAFAPSTTVILSEADVFAAL